MSPSLVDYPGSLYSHVVSEDVTVDVRRLLFMGMPGTQVTSFVYPSRMKEYSLLDLEGLGKEIWEGVDPVRYVRELRDEWGTWT